MPAQPLKVMVLDDDPNYLSSMYDLLTKSGYEVYPFSRPEKAWDFLGMVKPDFLILDLNMPMLDGREFLPWARKECPEVTVFICTGLDVHLGNSIFKENGVRAILKKPVSSADVIAALQKAAK